MPTIMAAAGLDVPDEVDGVAQQDLDGVSLLPAFEDPESAEQHQTQYFEMMGSRSIYHEGWKATTDHISTGVLDEEELAVGSRDFAEDRWELFDLSADFSEATDRAGDEPERLRTLADLWDAEAVRNNVLPISDGLVDRFAGFIPPAWPAGSSRIFRPGGGPVADESVPLLWGGFRMTAAVDTGPGTDDGVIFALGDWFGGYRPLLRRAAWRTSPSPVPRTRSSSRRRRLCRRDATRSVSSTRWAPTVGSAGCCCRSTGPRSTGRASRARCRWRCNTAAPAYGSGTTPGSRCRLATRPRLHSPGRCTNCGSTPRARCR